MTVQSRPKFATDQRWFLTGCIEHGASVQQFDISTYPFSIGRRADCELALRSRCVSGHHAELVAIGASLILRDLNSTNGTFVNGERLVGECAIDVGDRLQFADTEFAVDAKSAQQQKSVLETLRGTVVEIDSFESLWVISRFEQLMKTGLFAAYQPIISTDDFNTIHGFEALARSNVKGLERPDQMFSSATQLHKQIPLSHLCRSRALTASTAYMAESQPLFLNTHPAESLFRDVLPSLEGLRERAPNQRLAIEIHEGAVTCTTEMGRFAAALRDLDIKLAYDDFGAGQTRLRELVEVPPDYIKFDRGLITGLHTAPEIHQDLVRKLVETSKQVGAQALAEGIEEPECAKVCQEIGFDLLQGYLFGRPFTVDSQQS